MSNYPKYILRKPIKIRVIDVLKYITVGLLIGQFLQPLPFVWRDGFSFSQYTGWVSAQASEGGGYIKDDRQSMNAFIDENLPKWED